MSGIVKQEYHQSHFSVEKTDVSQIGTEEQEMPECPKPVVTDGVLAMLLHRIEKLETQVRILKGEKQKRSYKKASDYSKNDFLTQTEAYRYIGCSQCTIIKWTNKGMLKGYRKGQHLYYKKSELDNNPVVQNFKNINRI